MAKEKFNILSCFVENSERQGECQKYTNKHCDGESQSRAGDNSRSDWFIFGSRCHMISTFAHQIFGALWLAYTHQATHSPSTAVYRKVFACINSTDFLKGILSLYRSMGFTMHCLLCGRRSSSSGKYFLNLFRKIAPSVVNVCVRGVVLFILGTFFAMVLFTFSVLPEVRRRRIQDIGIIAKLFSAVWWIAPSSGTAAAVVGLIYPCSDIRLGKPHKLEREWSSVFKCVVLFLGISHACAVSFPLLCPLGFKVI